MAKERKERATHRSHSAGQELRRGSTCKPTNCEIEDSPTDSRATFSSSVSSPPPNRGRCRDPSSKRESCHPPILSTATEACRRESPGKKRIVHRFNAIIAFLDFDWSVGCPRNFLRATLSIIWKRKDTCEKTTNITLHTSGQPVPVLAKKTLLIERNDWQPVVGEELGRKDWNKKKKKLFRSIRSTLELRMNQPTIPLVP